MTHGAGMGLAVSGKPGGSEREPFQRWGNMPPIKPKDPREDEIGFDPEKAGAAYTKGLSSENASLHGGGT